MARMQAISPSSPWNRRPVLTGKMLLPRPREAFIEQVLAVGSPDK
jgi:hypothetical protein